jgi:hypothetical protein
VVYRTLVSPSSSQAVINSTKRVALAAMKTALKATMIELSTSPLQIQFINHWCTNLYSNLTFSCLNSCRLSTRPLTAVRCPDGRPVAESSRGRGCKGSGSCPCPLFAVTVRPSRTGCTTTTQMFSTECILENYFCTCL